MILAAAVLLTQAPVRARDPWVFRATFEDRPRQLIIALGSVGSQKPLWMAFNPSTCAVRKVWRGQVDLRGKVYDFSQENSRAQGDILAELDEELLSMPRAAIDGWSTDGVRVEDGWRFEKDGATVTSPYINYNGFLTRYASFDEFGNKGRISIQMKTQDGKVSQDFQSSGSGLGANTWQWNYKELQPMNQPHRFVISAAKAEDGKRVRNFRVFGDPIVWRGTLDPVPAQFLGYRVNGTKSVTIRLNIGGAEIDWTPEATADGWTETFTVRQCPASGLLYRRSKGKAFHEPKLGSTLMEDEVGTLRFKQDGTYSLRWEG